jgi:LysM repeat protein
MAAVIVAAVCIVGSFFGYFDASSMDEITYQEYEVQAGDTLWQIARETGSANTDVRQTIYEICQVNDISAETLFAGSVIQIPLKSGQ